MKRIVSGLILAVMLMTMLPVGALASQPDPIPVLSEDEIRQTPKGIYHYMLICMDCWGEERIEGTNERKPTDLNKKGHHTDGLVLVTVDTYARRVMLTSFIRDMLIWRSAKPDGSDPSFGRINNILEKYLENGGDGVGGIERLIDTINSHFDLRIEKYIVVDFRQVQRIIDAIGGVDIKIDGDEAKRLKSYNMSADATTPALAGAGTYHFKGYAAVIYMRIRKEAMFYTDENGVEHKETQDIGRTRRTRIVLSTIADSLKDITYEQAEQLLNTVVENTVYTNMSTNDMLEALDIAMDLKGTPVEGIRMPIDGSYELFPYAGMSTQQMDFVANREALWDFLMDPFAVVEDIE